MLWKYWSGVIELSESAVRIIRSKKNIIFFQKIWVFELLEGLN